MDAKTRKVEATLEERISTKSNKPYLCVVVKLTDKYEKVFFLDSQDTEILRLNDLVHSDLSDFEKKISK